MPDVRMPDGTVIRNVPAGTSRDEIMARYQRARQAGAVKDNRPKSFWQGFNDSVQTASSNLGALLENVNPVEMAIDKAAKLAGFPLPTQAENDAKYRRKQMTSKYQGSMAGDIVGGITAAIPTMFIPGGPVVQGAAGGALLTKDRSAGGLAESTVEGAIAGKLGDVFGRRVLAPVADRIGRTGPIRKVAEAVMGNRVLPMVSKAERTIIQSAPKLSEAQKNLRDAARLNLPYSLADAAPELRSLSGSVARKSRGGRALAERTFAPRALGQADRAVSAIDDRLAPITNIGERQAAIKTAAQKTSEPFYTAARARPAPVDDELATMVNTPAGKQALNDAYTIVQNQGRDPLKIGFDLDAQGNVMLRKEPSFETLQLVKRSLDKQLEPARNPVSNKLNLDGRPDLQAIDDLRFRLNKRMGELNDDYAKGNKAYSAEIARRDALDLGGDLFSGRYPERSFNAAVSRMNNKTMPELQRGYSTAMADKVDNVRLSGNPYNAIYGSPLQQKKVASLFPGGADDFGRQYGLESDMSKTAWETLGGSPTQQRAMTDQLFDANMGSYGEAAMHAMTNPKYAMAKAAVQKIQDTSRLATERRADELAPVLFDTLDPAGKADFLEEIIKKAELRRQAYRRAGGSLALPFAAGAVVSSQTP